VRVVTRPDAGYSIIEVHDSGPGLSADAAATLFEPTITFKEGGMGLGLSIAKRDAVVSGGDLAMIPGQLGGAAFGITLPDSAGTARQESL